MKKTLCLLSALLSLSMLNSCSVVMAARTEGTSITTVQQCRSRGQFIACGAKVVSSERLPNGDLVEVYQFKKERGSAARALMHGVLDVATVGLWEAVGTPIEAFDSEQFFSVTVTYDSSDVIKTVSLS